jgi:hypothetical protein
MEQLLIFEGSPVKHRTSQRFRKIAIARYPRILNRPRFNIARELVLLFLGRPMRKAFGMSPVSWKYRIDRDTRVLLVWMAVEILF